jgi:uncharacterized membrane protein
MNSKLKRFTTTALLVALIFILGLTPIGYIPIPPIKVTLICIPVIIGTIALGLRTGLLLGFFFGITSLIQVWFPAPDLLGQFLLGISPLKLLVIIFIPRLLVPLVTWVVLKVLETDYEIYIEIALFAIFAVLGIFVNWMFLIPAALMLIIFIFFRKVKAVKMKYGLSALLGSFTNTVFFLGGLYLLYYPNIEQVSEAFGTTADGLFKILAGIGVANGVPEAIVALVICVPVLVALNKMGYIEEKEEIKAAEK